MERQVAAVALVTLTLLVVATAQAGAISAPAGAHLKSTDGGPSEGRVPVSLIERAFSEEPQFAGGRSADDGATPSSFATIPVGVYPFGEAYDPVNARLYVADFGNNNVSVIDTVTNLVIATIPLTYGIEDPAYDSSDGLVYIGDCCSSVYAINATTDRTVASIVLGAGCLPGCAPVATVFDYKNQDVYTIDGFTDNLSVINGQSVVAVVGAGTSPDGLGYDSTNGDLYVSNDAVETVTIINGSTNLAIGSIPSVQQGSSIVADTENGNVFVAGRNGTDQANVTEINPVTQKVVGVARTENASGDATFDPVTGNVYVSQRYDESGDVSGAAAINGTTGAIVGELPTQKGPIGIAYNSFNHEIYVADSETNNVSLLFPLRSIAFYETGLPAGTAWSVSLNNQSLESNTTQVPFTGADGPFQYLIHHVPGYSVTPRTGSFTMNGSDVTVDLTFAPVAFAATFNETGLPIGTQWSVTVNGTPAASLAQVVSVTLKNGTYNFTVDPPAGFRVVPLNGSLTINGTNKTVHLVFTAIPASPTPTYLGLTASEWAIAIALVAIIAAVAIFLLTRKKRRDGQTVSLPTSGSPPPKSP